MSDLTPSRKSDHATEYNDHKHFRRFFRPKKSSSVVVLNPILNLPDKHTNVRIVRLRLVFIHIGEKNF